MKEKGENKILEQAQEWFFWFWIRQMKISFLLVFLVIIFWALSIFTIWKDRTPELDLWFINITTVYTWVNPEDIDSLITDKIEREVKDIDGLKKIESTSKLWVSSVTLELKNWVDVNETLTDVKSKVDIVDLPSDAEDPVVTDVSSEDNNIFSIVLYWEENKYSHDYLLSKADELKNSLEWKSGIDKFNVRWTTDYEVRVLANKAKLENLWLSVAGVANILKDYNKNTPLWNFTIDNLDYDYRFSGEIKDIKWFLDVPIASNWTSITYLKDIAKLTRYYDNDNVEKFWIYNQNWFNWVYVSIDKKDGANVFSSTINAKANVEKEMQKQSYDGLKYDIVQDVSDILIDDYDDLLKNILTTLFLVFATLLTFIWLKEWIIATSIIPLAYFITFIVLNYMGYKLNFLTNFSLILSLWVAIDTIIVIIEWASNNMRLWYNPKTAVILAGRDYRVALISGTMTTLAAFFPIMSLPGAMWKYLAYIPITIFITLLASLFLSLTVTSAIFMKVNKKHDYFVKNPREEKTMWDDEKNLLENERRWKTERLEKDFKMRFKVFNAVKNTYYNILKNFINAKWKRLVVIFVPVVVFFWTFSAFPIWFNMFPASDQPFLTVTIESNQWRTTDSMAKYSKNVDEALTSIPELKNYFTSVSWNKVKIDVELLKTAVREEKWLRSSFEIEKVIEDNLAYLRQEWLKVNASTQSNGPPGSQAVWIKLIAESTDQLRTLLDVSDDFEKFLRTVPWAKNVTSSGLRTPGQFSLTLDRNKLASLGLKPTDIEMAVFAEINWMKAWTIKWVKEDYDIKVKIDAFDKEVTPYDIMNLTINTAKGKMKVSDVANSEFERAIANIDRENQKIIITVWADLEEWINTSEVQPKLTQFAEQYKYPAGTSFGAGWENEENAELVISMVTSFFVAIFIIFTILVLQFNSYGQPLIVLYSVIMALIWVNIWLFSTWNPYSLAFWIWFISLVWIVVNNAIIYIDKINSNLAEWMETMESVLNAWKSRFIPMLVTTITTVLWILPLAFQDKFWAWLSYTIVFWLLAGTTMTLFVVPALYYESYLNKKPWLFKFIFKYTFGLPKLIFTLLKNREDKQVKKTTNIIDIDNNKK